MTARDSAGPRQDPPGPAPHLEAVERLRRQLDALESKSRRRTEPRTPRASTRGSDSTQLFGSDPYAKAAYDSHPNTSYESRNAWSAADPYANPSRDTWQSHPADHGLSNRDAYGTRIGDTFESGDPDENPPDDSYEESPSRLRRRRSATPDSDDPADSAAILDGDQESDEPPSKPVRAQRNTVRTQRTTSPDQSRSTWGRRREEAPPTPTGTDGEERESGRKARGGRRGYRSGGGESGDSGLPGGGTEAQAKEVCLRLLTDRARSRSELATKLADRGYSEAVANKVLDRLTEVGLIDDAAFAQQWVQSRHTFSGKGKRALAQELRRKGVGQEEAEEALSAISSDDEHERAADLVRRKLRTLPRDLDREKAIRRLVGMLARRGYNSGTAYAVVKAELAGAGNGSDASEID